MFFKIKNKNSYFDVQNQFILKNYLTFLSKERLINLVRGRERFVGHIFLLVYVPIKDSNCTQCTWFLDFFNHRIKREGVVELKNHRCKTEFLFFLFS